MSTHKPPPKNYKCHKCKNVGDHWIMNCPEKENKGTNNSITTESPLNWNINRVPDQITVYWDYETMPINKSTNLIQLLATLKNKLWSYVGFKLPIQILVYLRISKLTQHIQTAFDVNGIIQIPVPDSVSKRMIVDILLCLYELQRDNKTRAFGIISSDVDFAHLFSKIQNTAPVFDLSLILLHNIEINDERCLSQNVQNVIQLNHCNIIHGNSNDNISIVIDLNVNGTKKVKRKVKEKNGNLIHIHITNKHNYKSQRTMNICVAKNIKINQLKKMIRCKYISHEYTHACLILQFKKKKLQNQQKLNQFNIKNGDTLIWCWKMRNKKIKLQIKQSDSKNKFYLKKFEMNTQIQHLRRIIYCRNERLNIPIHAFKLFYQGIELMDYNSLMDYGVSHNAAIISITWCIDHSSICQQLQVDDVKFVNNMIYPSHYNHAILYEHNTIKYDEPIINNNINNNIYGLNTECTQYNEVKYNGCTYYSQKTEYDEMQPTMCWDYLSTQNCPPQPFPWSHVGSYCNIDSAELTDIENQKHEQKTGHEMINITNQNETINTMLTIASNDMIRITIQSRGTSCLFSCFTSEFQRNATIKSVQDKITDIDKTLMNSTQQMFVTFKGDILSKDKTFEYYGIGNGDILMWYKIDKTDKIDEIEIDIDISDMYGNTIIVKVNPTININNLKNILAMNYPTWYIKDMEYGWFRFKGQRLNAMRSLVQCGISNGDKLEWLCQYN